MCFCKVSERDLTERQKKVSRQSCGPGRPAICVLQSAAGRMMPKLWQKHVGLPWLGTVGRPWRIVFMSRALGKIPFNVGCFVYFKYLYFDRSGNGFSYLSCESGIFSCWSGSDLSGSSGSISSNRIRWKASSFKCSLIFLVFLRS